MAIYNVLLRYYETLQGQCWTIRTFQNAASHTAAQVLANAWNTKYLVVCPAEVNLLDCRIKDALAVPTNEFVTAGGVFVTPQGTAAGTYAEIASYAQVRGYGSLNGGTSAWKLHGIASSFVVGSLLDTDNTPMGNLLTACLTYMNQYRPTATPAPPAGRGYLMVSPPQPFPQILISGMYDKALGRPFLLPGQQRFVRHHP